jgi:hypothetical protein
MAQRTGPLAEQLRAQILAMRAPKPGRAEGFSTRMIAERFKIGESTVRDLSTGRRGMNETRAAEALQIFRETQPSGVEYLTGRDASLAGRYARALQDAQRSGNYRTLADRFGRRPVVVQTAEGPLSLATDPAELRALSDAGLEPLRNQTWVSPKKSKRRAAYRPHTHRRRARPTLAGSPRRRG